jgi:hypothetical protein
VNEETRTQTNVRGSLFNRRDEVVYFTRIVLQISILNDDDRTRTRRKASPESGCLTLIGLVPKKLDPLLLADICATHLRCAIA